jgi:Leucine-rich repeat (LRR) protein
MEGPPQWAFDNALSCAWHLKSLQDLSLEGLPITIRSLNNLHIEDLKQLRALEISNTHIDGKDLARLQPLLHRLNMLGIGNLHNASAILRALQGSKNLERLNVARDGLTNSDISILATLLNLKEVDLSGSNITDVCLVKLTKLKNLSTMALTDCPITAVGVKTLARCPQLKALTLSGSLEKDKGAIEAVLPGCHISFESKNHRQTIDPDLEDMTGQTETIKK